MIYAGTQHVVDHDMSFVMLPTTLMLSQIWMYTFHTLH